MTTPVFEDRTDERGKRIVCRIGAHEGTARVFSKGEQDARDRAEAQARQKAARGAAE